MVHPAASKRSGLTGLQREYSLNEAIAMTSTGPARTLGLADRGHLGPGAIADVRCYRPQKDWQAMFSAPEWVMKSGKMVIKAGKVLEQAGGKTLCVRPGWDPAFEPTLRQRLSENTHLPLRSYGLAGHLANEFFEVIPCKSTA
jgi:formylmethanofuran dehydrogenase subunit A